MTDHAQEMSFPVRLRSALGVVSWRNVPFVVALCLGGIVMLLPFLWMVGASFRPAGEAYRLPPSIFPTRLHMSGYVGVFESGLPFLTMYWNSFVVATATTLGVLASSAMAAFAFARLRFRGRDTLFLLMLIGLMVPPSVVLVPLYFGFAWTGIINTELSLILPALASSFGIYMIRQFMLDQPRELEEAAIIDGAGYWTIFTTISLPQVAPGLAALGIITFTSSWNNFVIPFVMISDWNKMTLPVGIVALQAVMDAANLSVVMAALAMSILPLFVVFLVAQRYIVEGMTLSGIKG